MIQVEISSPQIIGVYAQHLMRRLFDQLIRQPAREQHAKECGKERHGGHKARAFSAVIPFSLGEVIPGSEVRKNHSVDVTAN